MHCVTQAPHPLLCPDLDKWPPRDDDGPPRIGLSEDGTGIRQSNLDCGLQNALGLNCVLNSINRVSRFKRSFNPRAPIQLSLHKPL